MANVKETKWLFIWTQYGRKNEAVFYTVKEVLDWVDDFSDDPESVLEIIEIYRDGSSMTATDVTESFFE